MQQPTGVFLPILCLCPFFKPLVHPGRRTHTKHSCRNLSILLRRWREGHTCGVQKNTLRVSHSFLRSAGGMDCPVSCTVRSLEMSVVEKQAPICWSTRGRVGATKMILPVGNHLQDSPRSLKLTLERVGNGAEMWIEHYNDTKGT